MITWTEIGWLFLGLGIIPVVLVVVFGTIIDCIDCRFWQPFKQKLRQWKINKLPKVVIWRNNGVTAIARYADFQHTQEVVNAVIPLYVVNRVWVFTDKNIQKSGDHSQVEKFFEGKNVIWHPSLYVPYSSGMKQIDQTIMVLPLEVRL